MSLDVARLAPTDFVAAHELARTIPVPWLQCRALAWVARYADVPYWESVAQEALDAASRSEAKFGLAALGWLARAAVERRSRSTVSNLAAYIVSAAQTLSSPISRVEALSPAWFASVYRSHLVDESWAYTITAAIVAAATSANTPWACERLWQVNHSLEGSPARKVAYLKAMMPRPIIPRQTKPQEDRLLRLFRCTMFSPHPALRYECWAAPAAHRYARMNRG